MKKFTKWSSALAMVFVAASVQAVPVPLSDLIAGDTITWGDKLFAEWRLVLPTVEPEFAAPLDLTKVLVEGVGDGSAGNEYGLQFTGGGELLIVGDDDFDLYFGFSVEVLDPGMLINGAFMTGIVDTLGDHLITVEKEVLDAANAELAFMDIYSDVFVGFPDDVDLDNSIGFAAASKVWIQDNIFVGGDFADSEAELVSFTQRFRQVPTAVPVPGTIALFALGLLGLAGFSRRQPQ